MTFDELITLFTRFIHRMNDVDVCQFAGLAKGTNSATIKTVNDFVYSLYNQQLSKSATDNIAVTACTIQAEATTCYYMVSINLAGTVLTTKGTATALPAARNGYVPFGAFKIVTATGYTFTAGTTDLAATGITATFYDIDTGIAPMLINQSMRSLERKANFRGMKRRAPAISLTTTASTSQFNNPFPLYKELLSAYAKDASNVQYPINKFDLEAVEGAFADSQTGPPKLIAEVPGTVTSLTPDAGADLEFMIRPFSDAAYSLYLTAYLYTPFLDGIIYASNWWTENHHDILLYGALVEAEPYLKNDSRVELWKNLFTEKLADLAKSEGVEITSGASRYTKGAE